MTLTNCYHSARKKAELTADRPVGDKSPSSNSEANTSVDELQWIMEYHRLMVRHFADSSLPNHCKPSTEKSGDNSDPCIVYWSDAAAKINEEKASGIRVSNASAQPPE